MSRNYRAPRGTRDILPVEIERWHRVEQAAHRLFQRYGYREIRTPIFERRELFERGVGETSEIVEKQMYIFQDRGGDWLALRPEGTAPVIRAFVEHAMHQAAPPYRYYYIGPMFRHERPQKGRFRQFHQIGVEVLGESDPATDAEVIAMSHRLLETLRVQNCELELNSIGCAVCRPRYLERLVAYFSGVKEQLCPDCQRRLERNPLRILDCKNEQCRHLTTGAPDIKDAWCEDCRSHFEAVLEVLDRINVPYRRNPFLVRGLDYYMRTTFEFIAGELGAQNAVLGGGRYDGLVRDLGGPDWPGVGFAIGMERLIKLLPPVEETSPLDVTVIPLDAESRAVALAWAEQARQSGVRVWVRMKITRLKSGLRAAHRSGARFTLMIGPDERARGRWTLRNMATGEQQDLPPDELLAYLRKNPVNPS